MMAVKQLAGCIAALLLAGCGGKLIKPEVIHVDRPAYRALPVELTAPCDEPVMPDYLTNGGLADYAVSLRDALRRCNLKLDGIRALQ